MCTERKTDPKSRYFRMFESTFDKCLIQLSVELILLDIVYDSLNYLHPRCGPHIVALNSQKDGFIFECPK